jgi:hypothetical protein
VPRRLLSRAAAISGLYDGVVGALLLCAPGWFAATFSVAPASPPIFSELNGLFLLAVGIGFALPCGDPERYRGYLWVMGPFLKGAGAAAFLLEYFLRGSPPAFLLFAAADAAIGGLTLYALLARRH